MREIKFKAWDRREKKMWRILRLDLTNIEGLTWEGVGIDKNGDEKELAGSFCDLIQFIGLKDKNGKDSYHKDIVQDNLLNINYIIEWKEGNFFLKPIGIEGNHYERNIKTINVCKIIGNKFKNLELLEGGSKNGNSN